MSNPVAGIDIVARLDKFRTDMEQIPEIGATQARALTRQLSKEIKAAEAAAKKAGAAGRATKKDFDGMGDAAGKAGSNAAKLAGILDRLAPGLGQVAMVGNDVGDALEVGAGGMSAMGPAAAVAMAAAALLVGTYAVLNDELEDAEATMGRAADRADLLADFSRQLEMAERAAAVATGELSEAEADALNTRDRWNDATAKTLEGIEAQRKAIEDELRPGVLRTVVAFFGLEQQVDSLAETVADAVGWLAPLAKLWDEDRKESEGLRVELEQLDLVVDRVNEGAERGVALEGEATSAKRRSAAASRADAEAERAREEALRAAEQAAQELIAATAAYDGALSKLGQIQDQVLSRHLDADAVMVQSRERALEQIAQAEQEAVEAAGYQADRALEIEEAAVQARTAVWDAYYMDLEAKREEDARAAAEAAERLVEETRRAQLELAATTLGGLQSATDLVVDGVGSAYQYAADNASELLARQDQMEEHLTAGQRKALQERVDAAKAAARASFNSFKAAQMAQATIGIASAFISALDDAPFPFNLALAGLSVAAGVGQLGVIASTQPAFHGGGEVDATLLDGEYVSSRQGRSVLGDKALKEADAGIAPQQQDMVLITVYEHTRQARRYKRDGLLRNDPVKQAINAGRILGQRAVGT